MEPEHETVINLFDSIWFYSQIFNKQSNFSISSKSETNPDCHDQENSRKPKISSQLTIHTRSKSDQLNLINSITGLDSDSSSPNTVLFTPHLSEPDLSKEIPKEEKSRGVLRNRKKKSLSKSLSELEVEELRGFMDLGFVFSEEDRDSSLVEIIPGLQRLGKKMDGKGEEVEGNGGNEFSVPRPYLSEAWDVIDERKREKQNPLMNWKVPVISNQMDMKDSLKLWAHTVAYAVR